MLGRYFFLWSAFVVLILGPGAVWAQGVDRPRYAMEVAVDTEAKTLVAQEKVSFTNNSKKPLSEVYFHVYPNRIYSAKEKNLLRRYSAYFKVNAFPDGFPKDVVAMHSVKVAGAERAWSWEGEDQTLLKIPLALPLAPGQSLEIDFEFTLTLPRAYSRFGWQDGTIKLSQWYPLLAVYDDQGWRKYPSYPFHRPFFSESAFYSVHLTVPDSQIVIHTGVVASEESKAGQKILQIETLQPVRDFTLAMSADYQLVEDTLGGVRIKSFYLPGDVVAGQAALADAKALLEYYTGLFGPYPYTEFSIAPVPLGYGGEQMSNLIFIDSRAYKLPGFLRRYFDFLVSHETGHQWFYNVVGVDEYTQMWLEEGVNSYFILKYLENKYGAQPEIIEYPNWAQAGTWLFPKFTFSQTRDYLYKRMMRVGHERQPVLGSLSRFREPSSIFFLAYGKGARIVGMLEHELGEKTFERIFRRIWKEYQFKNFDIQDFRKLCEEESGRDLGWFFDQWLKTTKYLDYQIEGVKEQRLMLRSRGGIQAPASIKVRYKNGEEQVLLWDGKKTREALPLSSKSPVVQAVIDPQHDLLDVDRTNNFWPRKVSAKAVPFYWGLYDMPLFQDEDSFNFIIGPETANSGIGLKAALHKPYDQTLYSGVDYELGPSLQHSRAGYVLKNFLRSPAALGVEIQDTKDWDGGEEDQVAAKLYLRRELWPSAYSLSEINDHVTFYLVRNQRLSDRSEFLDYREEDHQLEYSRREESIVGVTFKISNNGPAPDPLKGYQLNGWLENAGHFWGATQSFTRSALETVVYQPATPKTTLAFRGKYGWGFPEDKDLYQLGGMEDLRGYDYKSFHGASMGLVSAEYRFPLRENLKWTLGDHLLGVEALRGVTFWDAGSVWYDNADRAKWRQDAGLGLRFIVNIGSMLEKAVVRLDAAYPLNGTDHDVHFWLGMNHAF